MTKEKHKFQYYIDVAKELCYSKECIEKIKNAATERECINTLTAARLGEI